ncbi:hypothetical protein SB3_31680, partial [Methylobacterium radiotolerans]
RLEKIDIARVRRRASRHGMTVQKSRARRVHPRNHGGLLVADARTGAALAGETYDLDSETADAAIDRLLREGRGY